MRVKITVVDKELLTQIKEHPRYSWKDDLSKGINKYFENGMNMNSQLIKHNVKISDVNMTNDSGIGTIRDEDSWLFLTPKKLNIKWKTFKTDTHKVYHVIVQTFDEKTEEDQKKIKSILTSTPKSIKDIIIDFSKFEVTDKLTVDDGIDKLLELYDITLEELHKMLTLDTEFVRVKCQSSYNSSILCLTTKIRDKNNNILELISTYDITPIKYTKTTISRKSETFYFVNGPKVMEKFKVGNKWTLNYRFIIELKKNGSEHNVNNLSEANVHNLSVLSDGSTISQLKVINPDNDNCNMFIRHVHKCGIFQVNITCPSRNIKLQLDTIKDEKKYIDDFTTSESSKLDTYYKLLKDLSSLTPERYEKFVKDYKKTIQIYSTKMKFNIITHNSCIY